MCDLDVDVGRAVGGSGCWVLEEIEGEATGAGEPGEGGEGGAEVGDCLDRDRHFDRVYECREETLRELFHSDGNLLRWKDVL